MARVFYKEKITSLFFEENPNAIYNSCKFNFFFRQSSVDDNNDDDDNRIFPTFNSFMEHNFFHLQSLIQGQEYFC